MEPVRTNARPAVESPARRPTARALRPDGQVPVRVRRAEEPHLVRRQRHRTLAAGLASAPTALAHVRPASDAPAIRETRDAAVAGSKVLADGNISVAFADGSSKVYQKVPHGWSLVAWNHPAATSPGWIEDSWLPDGTLVENYWSKKDHGTAGSADQYSQLTVQKGTITLTLYHAKGVRTYSGLYNNDTSDATVVWTYSRRANGGIGTLQAYHVSEPNSSYAADYINPQSGLPSNYWASGWLQYLPNNYSVAVPDRSASSGSPP